MTILQSGGFGTGGVVYPLASDVVSSVSDDLLQRIAPEDPIMVDYVNRVQLQVLRASRWQFLLQPPQRFVTQLQQSDYWIGPAGQNPLDVFDTGLNIQNIGPIKTDTVCDRSNFRLLYRTKEQLLASQFAFRDGSSRQGPPRTWRVDVGTPNMFSVYPAPDNQNNFQPVPEAPSCSAVAGGGLPARIYFVRTTFVDSLENEGSASVEQRVFLPANTLLVVQPPIELPDAASGVQYNFYNVYIFNAGAVLGITTGSETLVTSSPLQNTGTYVEPAGGFATGGVSFPTASNLEIMGGYLIEFRYFLAKPRVVSLTQPLLIPFDYLDVMISGVNYFLSRFLRQEGTVGADDVSYWKKEFDSGVVGMIRDKNLFPKAPDFIHPDPSSLSYINYYGYESIDPYYLPTS
jgi:hypothetical protein